uniref:Peroxiredoxin like 2C n=1 Tax=Callithrix jacchus TaxID=9483 RepID=A0A8I3VW49_CALJA
MAAPGPVTRQVSGGAAPVPAPSGPERGQSLAAAVAELPVLDARGQRVPFGALFRERRAVVVFVRHFLCYICKEYVEDLARIPKSFLQEANVTLIVIGQSSYHHIESFCKLTGYSHEIYVDPEREIYKRLGMKRGEEIASSGQSPHVKSNLLSGSLQSLWRAVTGPLFDFQGDPAQQGGTLILGPGEHQSPKFGSRHLVPFTSSEASTFFIKQTPCTNGHLDIIVRSAFVGGHVLFSEVSVYFDVYAFDECAHHPMPG